MQLLKEIMLINRSLVFLILAFCTGCANLVTKESAFPEMYGDLKPQTLLVVPAINNTTAADAPNYLNVTITQPLEDSGYYVLPMPIVSAIFEREGVVDGTQIRGFPPQLFKTNFGADAVLFITINEWDRNYYIIGGNVTVDLDYLMLSTVSGDVLWSYSGQVVMDTSGNSSSGNPLVDLISNTIATAISTASTRYVNVASMVHKQVLTTIPLGSYHPKSGADKAAKVVDLKKLKPLEQK